MENGADEPEQSETSAEIVKSAHLEDAVPTKVIKAEVVHEIVENALSEKSDHSNAEVSPPTEDDNAKKVTEIDQSVTAPEIEVDSGSAEQVDDSDAALPDGGKEVKEPENETKSALQAESEHSVSSESEPQKDSVMTGDKEKEPPPVQTEPEDISKETMASESTEGHPSLAVAEVSKEEKTADVTKPAPESDTATAIDSYGNIELPTSHEALSNESHKNEEFGTSQEEPSEENAATNDVASAQESVGTASIVEDKHVELSATKDELAEEGNGAASIEDDRDTQPATVETEHPKNEEAVKQEAPSTSDSAAPPAVEEDKQVASLTVHEKSTKQDTITDESSATPATTVEGTGPGDKDVEPAIVEEESPKENVAHEEAPSKEEAPEPASVVQHETPGNAKAHEPLPAVENEAPPSSETDEAGTGVVNAEVETVTTGAKSVQATAVEEERDVTPAVANEELTKDEVPAGTMPREATQDIESTAPPVDQVPNDFKLAPESTAPTPVENADVDSSELAAPHEGVKPDELGSSPEATSVEDVKHVEPEALRKEIVADEATSTVLSPEASPVGDAKHVEPEVPHSEEIATDEVTSTGLSPETSPVEEKGVEAPTPLEEPALDNRPTGEPAQTPESVGSALVGDAKNSEPETLGDESTPEVGPPTADELSIEERAADGQLPADSADVISAVESKGGEASVPHGEPPQEGIVADEVGHAPESVEDAKEAETETVDEDPKQEETILPAESVEPTPIVEDREGTLSHAELDATAGAAQVPESSEAIPVEHEEGAEPGTADGLDEEEKLGGEVPSADAIPILEKKDVGAPTLPEKLAHETVTDELSPPADGTEGTSVDDAKVAEPSIAKDEVDKAEVLGEEIPSTEDVTESTPAVEDKGVEAPTSHTELAKDETTAEVGTSQQSVTEEIPLTAASEDVIPAAEGKDVDVAAPHEELAKEDTTDEVAQSPKLGEAPFVDDARDAEPVIHNVVLNQENVIDKTPLTTDSTEASPVVEGKDLESHKEVEAVPSHGEVSREVTVTDDLSPGPEHGKTTSFEDVEDEGSVAAEEVVNKEADVTPAIEDNDVEGPTPQAEHLSTDEIVPKDSNTTHAVEEKSVETSTPHEELVKEKETADEAAQPPESETAALVEDTEDRELAIDDEGASKVENVADVAPSTTHLAKADIPAVEDKEAEAATLHEELAKEETKDEGAQHPESVADETTVAASSEEVSVPTSDVEPAKEEETIDSVAQSQDSAADEVPLAKTSEEVDPSSMDREFEAPASNEEFAKDETAPDDSSLVSDSSEATSEDLVEGSKPLEELSKEETKDEAAQAPESVEAVDVEDATEVEPVTLDEDANKVHSTPEEVAVTSESAETIPTVEDKDLVAPTSHEGLAKEGTTDDVSQSEMSAETIPAVEDKDLVAPTSHEGLAKEETTDDLSTASKDAIPAVENEGFDLPTPHEEPTKEEIADEVPQSQESTAGEVPSTTASEDAIPAVKEIDLQIPHEEHIMEVTTDEISSTTASEDAIPAAEDKAVVVPTPHEETTQNDTTDEVPQSQESAASEEPLTTASEDAIPTVEDKGVDLPTPHEEHVMKEATDEVAQAQELVSREIPSTTVSEDSIPAMEDKDVDVAIPAEEPAKQEEATDEAAQSQESVAHETEDKDVDMSILAEEPAKEEQTTLEVPQPQESTADEMHLSTASADATPAVEDNEVDVSTPHEEPAKEKETTDEVAQPQESGEAPVIQLTKEAEPVTLHEDLNKELSAAGEVRLATNSAEPIPAAEEKNVDATTSHEEPLKEETIGDVSQSTEPVEASPSEENVVHEIPLTTDSADHIPTPEHQDVPTPQEEVSEGKTVAEDLPAIPVEGVKNAEPVAAVADVKEEQSIGEEQSFIHAVVDKDVDPSPTTLEEVAKEETATNSSAPSPEPLGVSPLVESEDVEPAVGKEDVEVRAQKEDKITPELPIAPESPLVTSSADNKDVESETDKELTMEKTLADGTSLTTDCIEPVLAVEAKDEEPPIPHKAPETEESTLTSEVEEAASPVTEGKDVEPLIQQLAVADEVPSNTTEPTRAPVTEAEKHVQPATAEKELTNSQFVTQDLTKEQRVANATDLAAEPAEVVDKHVLTADSVENEALRTLVTESPEAAETHADSSKLEEKDTLLAEIPKGALTGEGLVLEGDVPEKTLESSDLATTGDSGGATVETQEGHEEYLGNNLRSAVLSTSSAKAIQARDFEEGLLQELQKEKVQNVTQKKPEDEDKVSVPLSTHTVDLSSSWVSVSPIQSAEVQSASTGSDSYLSQRSQSGRPGKDLASSAGDGWRIVSEQDIAALGPSKSRDVDAGSSGAKFPFSVVLWCSQSMASLFGGAQK